MDDLMDLVERLALALRAEQRRRAASLGLPPAQLEVLRYLTRCNRYSDTPAAVAEFLDATPGTISQTLSALERKALVDKRPDPTDRRKVHCVPTEAGLALLAQIEPPEVRQALEGSDQSQTAAALTQLLTALQRARGGRTFGACGTCAHLRRENGFSCGLTGEALTPQDTTRLCREHTP
jgi:DNA-binding MarR family transcriptional regulator